MGLKRILKNVPPFGKKKRIVWRARKKLVEELRQLSMKHPETGRHFVEKGYTAKVLKGKGLNARFLKTEIGPNAFVMKEIGFNAKELSSAGYGSLSLVVAGFKAEALKSAGTGVQSLAVLGARKLLNIGYTVQDLVNAGISKKMIEVALKKREKKPEP